MLNRDSWKDIASAFAAAVVAAVAAVAAAVASASASAFVGRPSWPVAIVDRVGTFVVVHSVLVCKGSWPLHSALSLAQNWACGRWLAVRTGSEHRSYR